MDNQFFLNDCGTSDPLLLKLRGGNVRRYHAEGKVFDQNVAEHTWRTMVILLHLWPDSSATLIKAALYHDVEEGIIGDIRAPIKRRPSIREAVAGMEREIRCYYEIPELWLSKVEDTRLRIADVLELCLTCSQLPHEAAQAIFITGSKYLADYSLELDRDKDALHVLNLYKRIEGSAVWQK